MKGKILIADDEVRIRILMALLLKEEGYEVMAVENGREAVNALLTFNPDVVLLDQQMPVLTGVETLEEIKELRPNQTVVFVTDINSIPLAMNAIKKGAYDFIEKPFDNDNLLLKVKRAVEYCRMLGEIKRLKTRLQAHTSKQIIGENGGLKQVAAQVKRVAETPTTVLIHGESGTGKELIANAIHANSNRSNGPFVAVNCGAIPLSLMERELFGHEKGVFTDTKEAKAGSFEQANGGTFLLDEISELPLDAQTKLLRVLEERKITRIGGKKAIPIDVRIIAATNRILEEEVQKGRFRLDLLYRLNIFAIDIPPLRKRKKDIPLLVDYFISKHNKTLNFSVKSITQKAMDKISAYDWPGNIRDLENAIQSAMIQTPDGIIRTEHLPLRIKGYESIETITSSETEASSMKEINAQVEKELIQETLKRHRHNRTLTAESLNISRKTLFNKMKRYGIKS